MGEADGLPVSCPSAGDLHWSPRKRKAKPQCRFGTDGDRPQSLDVYHPVRGRSSLMFCVPWLSSPASKPASQEAPLEHSSQPPPEHLHTLGTGTGPRGGGP